MFGNRKHNIILFRKHVFRKNTIALFDEPQVCRSKQGDEQFPKFLLFLETNIRQTKKYPIP